MTANFCSQCGASTADVNFCPNCGRQVATLPEPTAAPSHSAESLPQFDYPEHERHSKIITSHATNGEPIVEFRKLHPNSIWLFVLQYLMRTSILLLLFALTIVVEPLLTLVLVSGYCITVYVTALLNYHHYKFEVSTRAFRKEHGIFHKYTVNIAFDQIQNINMRRSVLDQLLGLAHLEIETAGTGGKVKRQVAALFTFSEGYIPGITVAEARDVKALMLARIHANK